MIFNVPNHIQYIRNGLSKRFINTHGVPARIIKTQTRRLNRGIYQVGKDYAVQRKRGVKAEPDIRIVMDVIHEEKTIPHGIPTPTRYFDYYIRAEDAWAEGGYTPTEYEELYLKLNPKRDSQSRWVFQFHAIKVQT